MKSSVRYLILCGITWVSAQNALSGGFALVPGDLYGVVNGGIRQYDPELNEVATRIFTGMTVTEGLAFTAAGHLIFSGFIQSDHFVFELNATGMTVNSIDLNVGSLDRAAHADIDAKGRIYTATSLGLVEIPPEFSSFVYLDYDFSRASGVVVGPDDKLYVSDQSDGLLVIFDTDRIFETSFFVGSVPTGLDFDGNGNLYCTLFGNQQLVQIDVVAQSTSTILTGLSGASDITFAGDGTYYLSIDLGNTLQHRTADHSLIDSVSTGDFTDAIVVMPFDEPPPACEGDANGDGMVDPLDSGFAQARFGCSVGTGDDECDAADQSGDGLVDPLDVGFILARFGDCR